MSKSGIGGATEVREDGVGVELCGRIGTEEGDSESSYGGYATLLQRYMTEKTVSSMMSFDRG
jgi:hypothetical protein